MTQAGSTAPAGWHLDPSGAGVLRWWTGVSWSEHTVPFVAQEGAEVRETAPATETYEWERESASAHRVEAAEAAADEDDVNRWRGIPSRWSTLAVWMIVLVPLVTLVAAFAALLLYSWSGATWRVAAALTLPYLWVVAFAQRDVRRLRRLGHSKTASPAWAFATAPAYLIARMVVMRRFAGIGSAPIWIWLGASALAAGAAFFALLSVTSVYVPYAMGQIEQQLSVELGGGAVSCPVPIQFAEGAIVECAISDVSGTPGTVQVRLESLDGSFTYAPPEMAVISG